MNRIDQADDSGIDEALARLHQAGWSVGDAGFRDGAGGLLWIVSGSNGENLLRAEASTRSGAWIHAVELARSLGMLGR